MNDQQQLQRILDFWFGPLDQQGQPTKDKQQCWWKKDSAFDQKIKAEFLNDMLAAAYGDYDAALAEPEGRLALIILLDQFHRNVFRDTPRMFSGDFLALHWTLTGIDATLDQDLPLFYRIFFYMPLQHSEELIYQELSLRMFGQLAEEAPSEQQPVFEANLEFAVRHYEIIKTFGRFPHRNAILKRESTPQELAFLQQPNSSF